MSTIDQTQQVSYDDSYDDGDYQVTPPANSRRGRQVTSALVVLVVLVGAFWGGLEVQKHHGTTTPVTSRAGFAATFAGARTGTGTGATGTGTGSRSGTSTAGGAAGSSSGTAGSAAAGAATAGGFGGGFAGGGATAGQVTLVDGNNIYITEANGNVVKVTTGSSSTFTKSVTGSIADVKPGETVTVRGTTGTDGNVAATTVNIGSTGAATPGG